MLVEDDKSLREIYSIRLVAEGYNIVSAGDGEEALAMAVREKPELIIADVMMPKISGFDMLDIIRSTPDTKDIKVIMMTALSSEDQRRRGESLGANLYLVKSQAGIEDVVNAVHQVLGDRPADYALNNIGTLASILTDPPSPPDPIPAVPAPAAPAPSAPEVAPAPAPPPVAQEAVPTPAPATPAPAPTPVPAANPAAQPALQTAASDITVSHAAETTSVPAPVAPEVAPATETIPLPAPSAPAPTSVPATPAPAAPAPSAPEVAPAPAPTSTQAAPVSIPPPTTSAPIPAPNAPAAPTPASTEQSAVGERVLQPLPPDNTNDAGASMEQRMAEMLGEPTNAPAAQ